MKNALRLSREQFLVKGIMNPLLSVQLSYCRIKQSLCNFVSERITVLALSFTAFRVVQIRYVPLPHSSILRLLIIKCYHADSCTQSE